MQNVEELVIRIGLFYLFILLGFLTAKLSGKGEYLNKHVSALLINLLLPLLIVSTFLDASFDSISEFSTIALLTLMIHVVGTAVMYFRVRGSVMDNPSKGSLLLCATFNNAIFLPVPLTLIFIGEVGIPSVVFFSITQMLILTTLGTFLASAYSENDVDIRKALRKALLFPPFLAAVIGISLFLIGLQVPVFVDDILSLNGTVTTYLALFVVGLGIGTRFSLVEIRAALEVASVRQLLIPTLTFIVLLFVSLSDITKRVILIQALMPPAVFNVIYAAGFDLDAETAATVVTVGTVLLLPVVPFIPILFTF